MCDDDGKDVRADQRDERRRAVFAGGDPRPGARSPNCGDDTVRHLQSRVYSACDVLADSTATLEEVDSARRALDDMSSQLAHTVWPHSGYVDLYEDVGHLRLVALRRLLKFT